ncbi:MAG: histidine phosphatase family protein [Minisyncoccia bacterium]
MAKNVLEHRFFAFRHAEAVTAEQMLYVRVDQYHSPYSMDRARRLSPEGRGQALKLHDFLKDKKIMEAFASPANRAYTTAAIAAGIPVGEVFVLESLIYGDSTHSDETHFLNFLLDTGGDALRAHRLTTLRRRGKPLEGAHVFDAWGKKAWTDLKTRAFKHRQGNFLVVGHGILLQELFRTAASHGVNRTNRAARDEAREVLLDVELQNATGFCVHFEDKKLQSVTVFPEEGKNGEASAAA